MLKRYYQNKKKKTRKKSFQKKLVKDTKIFPKKKKTKRANIPVSDIVCILKKKKKRSVSMVANYIYPAFVNGIKKCFRV